MLVLVVPYWYLCEDRRAGHIRTLTSRVVLGAERLRRRDGRVGVWRAGAVLRAGVAGVSLRIGGTHRDRRRELHHRQP